MEEVYKGSTYRYWLAGALLVGGIALCFAERAHLLVPLGTMGMSIFTFPFIVDRAEKKYPTSKIRKMGLYYAFMVLLIGTFFSN
ncbi:hypothetical protein GXP67_09805 [Rhodocytophaga rosea]|uniref:Uncharacterized protein n=1 Tax=Rhodocytophaga rosea TaxID=2704465 RepID=A0A6C0GG07_9BACT|nr:hypothetical protein [Rhodocytophaga rosea]QHT66928.1 hypothetical protein GXP67_09805 [Rhodocytophaga rosea]